MEPSSIGTEAASSRVRSILADYRGTLEERTALHLGYPYNLDFDFGELASLQRFSINNLGDPWIESNYGVHAREFEVGVLDWFANLWRIPREEYWAYVTNCGTEGNLHGILVGREVLPDGILYCSKETHYSVPKAARMYRMDYEEVGTIATGEIDLQELRARLRQNVARPAIINVNIGTTVKGAVDDLDGIIAMLREEGYDEDRFYIHCDGALFGMMAPFCTGTDAASGDGMPLVSFEKPIGSVSVSGHKFIGAPLPCGVVMTRLRHVAALSSDIEYLNSRDATIMGSRNGHAALFMWYSLSKKGVEGMRADVDKCMRNAHALRAMLEEAGVPCMLNRLSSTVVFERPREGAFIRRWQLACEKGMAHVVVMPSVGLEKLRKFVDELVESRQRAGAAAEGEPIQGLRE